MHRCSSHQQRRSRIALVHQYAPRDSFPITCTVLTRGSVQQGLSDVQTHDR